MAKRLILPTLALVFAPAMALGDCYRANGDDGSLQFTAAAEGSEFTGEFSDFSVTVCMDGQDPASAGIEVTVRTASADTGDEMRDSELKGEHFFHVAEYPEASWESSELTRDGEAFIAEGKLSLRGIEKQQAVRLRFSDEQPPLLTGQAEILRLQWNVGTGEDYEDTDFIRNRVDLEFEIQLQPYSEG